MQTSGGVVGFSKFRGEDLTRVEGKNSGGLRTSLELCFGTSEIECSASVPRQLTPRQLTPRQLTPYVFTLGSIVAKSRV